MPAKIICWARTRTDVRDCASSTLTFLIVGKGSPAYIAREIDRHGQYGVIKLIDKKRIAPAPHSNTDHIAVAGHGVTVVYECGRRREFRA